MTQASPFRAVHDFRAKLGECPVWSAAEQVLYFVDIKAPSLCRFDPAEYQSGWNSLAETRCT